MQYLFRFVVLLSIFLPVPAYAAETIYKVLEQDAEGVSSHRAFDRTEIGDGIDPVLQFIMLDAPVDPSTAQLLWEASEKPIPWDRTADEPSYRMVEYAILPSRASLEYRIYVDQTGRELTALRHTRLANDGTFAVDPAVINELSDGIYDVHVHLLVPDRPTQILKQRIDVSDNEQAFDPVVAPEPEEGPVVTPGSGWVRATSTPDQIGDSHERAVAHWNVVPEQQVGDGFTVGVIAHHLDGIDRVEIAANGGDWVVIDTPSVNPRTESEEYFVALDLDGNEGAIELRAIAYPVTGQPYVVKPMGRHYSEQDLTLYTHEVGAVLELGAGRHELTPRNLPETGWLTVRPAPGVDREDVVLIGESRFWRSGRLKLENLTIELPWGGGGIMGATNEDDGAQVGNHVWFDRCNIYGEQPGRDHRDQTWWIAFVWETASYTGCEISQMETAFHGFRGIDTLARHCYVHDIYEDIFRSGGLHVNLRIEEMNRDYLIDRQDLTTAERPHPDIWQLRLIRDTIIQDVTATKNINAQGFFCGEVEDVAIVRVNIDTQSPWRVYQPYGEISNFLIQDSRMDGGSNSSRSSVVGRLVLRQNIDGQGRSWRPNGFDARGVELIE